jgi:hypothetical protein
MTMALGMILSRLANISRDHKGLWHFLSVRSRGKSRVELEKVRNEGTKDAIDHLPRGGVLRESGPDGWTREIWIPDAHQIGPFVVHLEHPGLSGDSTESIELQQPPKQLDEGDGASS